MIGEIIQFLLNILFTLFAAALILRCWFQYARVHPYHPLVQGIAQVTNWLVHPLRRIIPGFAGIDWASLVGAWITAVVYLVLVSLIAGFNVGAIILPAIGAGFFMVLKWALNLLFWIVLIQAIMSWVSPYAPLMGVLQSLTSPFLAPFRRVLPTFGGLDFSPLALIILTQIALMIVTRASFNLFGI